MTSCLHGFICDCPACIRAFNQPNLIRVDPDIIKEMKTDTINALKISMRETAEELKKNWMYVSVHYKNYHSASVPYLIRLNNAIIIHIARAASLPTFGDQTKILE